MPEAKWKPSMELAHQARNQGGYTRLEHPHPGGLIPVPSHHSRAPPRRLPPVSSQPKIAPRGAAKPPAGARHAAQTDVNSRPRQIEEPLSVADFVAQAQPGYKRSPSAENNLDGEQNKGLIELIHQLQGQVQQQQFQFNTLASEARENTADLRREIATLRLELSEHTCKHELDSSKATTRETSKRDASSAGMLGDQAATESYANVMDSPEVQALTRRLVQTDAEVTQLRAEVAALRDTARVQPDAKEAHGTAFERQEAAAEVEKEVVAAVEVPEAEVQVEAEAEIKADAEMETQAEGETEMEVEAEAEGGAQGKGKEEAGAGAGAGVGAGAEKEAAKQVDAETKADALDEPQVSEVGEAMAAVTSPTAEREAAEAEAAQTTEAVSFVDADRVAVADAGKEVTMASDEQGEMVVEKEGEAAAEEEGEAAAAEEGEAAAMLSAKVLSAAVESEVGPPTGEASKAQMSTDADGGAAAAASQGSISQEPKASVQEPEASVQETSLAVSTTLSIDEDAHVRLLLRSCSPTPLRTPKRHKEDVAIQEAAAAYANPHKEAKETTVGPSKETGSAETPKAVSTSVNIDDNGRVCITLRCGSAASIE